MKLLSDLVCISSSALCFRVGETIAVDVAQFAAPKAQQEPYSLWEGRNQVYISYLKSP